MPNFRDWQERNRSFESMAAFDHRLMNLLGGPQEHAVQVTGAVVTADFFSVLGAPALIGRTFASRDDRSGAPPTVVLSHAFWRERFGGRTSVIGQRISINATHHEVIGVMPPEFGFPDRRTLAFIARRGGDDDGRNYRVIARLRPSVTLGAARDDMAAIARRIASERPESNAGWSATVIALSDQVIGDVRRPLLVFGAAVVFVLLIACANVANLLLIRATARAREFTVRTALGAGRWRLVHQVLVESLVLSTAGAAFGLALAWLTVRLFTRLSPASLAIPRVDEISVDPRVAVFAIVLATLTALLCGVLPALASTHLDPGRELPRASRSVISGHRRSQGLMVVLEVALAVPLLVGAILMAQSFVRLSRVEPGFRTEGVLTVRMLLLPVKDRAAHAQIIDDTLARIRALPGVLAAGSIGRLPMDGGNSGSWYYRADLPEPPRERRPGGDISIVSSGYFAAMGIPLKQGRDFGNDDRIGSPHVAIVNETAARTFFGAEPAIGRRLRVYWNDSREVEIVGVVGDIRHGQLRMKPTGCLFLPNGQQPFPFSALVVRTVGNPEMLVSAIRREIHSIDPDQGIGRIETLQQIVADSIAEPRAQTTVFMAFAALALILTCVGIYGVLAYAVAQRTREIGVRLALGATRPAMFAFVLRGGVGLTAVGSIVGFGLAVALTRFMQGLLYEVKPLEPVAFAAVGAIIAMVAIAACAIPARRATRVDPALVLRDE